MICIIILQLKFMTNSKTIAGFLIVLEPFSIAERIPFYMGQNIIGRSESKATLVLKDVSVSQKHVRLFATPNKVTITDLGSKNGTKINSVYNEIEKDNQIEIDESMVIYLAEVKCKIQMSKNDQETMKTDLTDKAIQVAKEKQRKKVQLMMRMFEDQEELDNKKQTKDQFKNTKYEDDFDINEGFKGKQEEKQQKKNVGKKKNGKKNNESHLLKQTVVENSKSQTLNITKSTKQQQKNKVLVKQTEKEQKVVNLEQNNIVNEKVIAKGKDKKNKKNEQTNNEESKQIQVNKNSQAQKQMPNAAKGKRKNAKQAPVEKKNIEREVKVQTKEVKKPSKSPEKSKKLSLEKKDQNMQSKVLRISDKKQQSSRRKSERISNERETKSKNKKQQEQKGEKNKTLAQSKLSKPKQIKKSKQKDYSVSKEIILPIRSKGVKLKTKRQTSQQKQSDVETNLNDDVNTKKTVNNNRKKMVTQSLQKKIHFEINKRNIGKRVMFSSFIPCLNRKYFAIIEDINAEFDFLVMKQYRRTFKALLAICRGIPIVKYSWITDSQYYQKTLKYDNYLFKEFPEIYDAIQSVKQGQKVFAGHEFFFFSQNFHLPLNQIQMLIDITGGKHINKPTKLNIKSKNLGSKNCIALFCKYEESQRVEYRDMIKSAKAYGFEQLYTVQLLLDACEKQKIDWSSHKVPQLI